MLLEDLIISRVRVKMLQLFLGSPGTIFHVRDIVRRVDEEINAVRRELGHMEESGMSPKSSGPIDCTTRFGKIILCTLNSWS